MLIGGWGNYPRAPSRLVAMREPGEVGALVLAEPAIIARGAGRAYGDAAIGSGATLSIGRLDRMIAFDRQTNVLTVEAGVRLSEIIEAFVPRGFFPAVVPGTRHVTVGGMLAANAHGKNHHRSGGFGAHVERFTLVGADGREHVCSRRENPELFRATIGGMGLTGIIRDVSFRLVPIECGFIRNETIVAPDLDAALRAFEDSLGFTYTVAWIDGLARGGSTGRSIVLRGEHARRSELSGNDGDGLAAVRGGRTWRAPFDFPAFALNRWTVAGFNALYYAMHRPGIALVPLLGYFFPLDSIDQWNRIYGRRGFVQHQCVLPKARSRDALGDMLERVSARGNPSFLAVLKRLGPDDAGLLSFPMEGYTLALDFPACQQTFELLAELDRCVVACGGRIYLAKDALQSRATLEAGYPNLEAFRDLRRQSGAAAHFRSLQSDRLAL